MATKDAKKEKKEKKAKRAGSPPPVADTASADAVDHVVVADAVDASADTKKEKKRKADDTAAPEIEVDLSLPEPPSKRAKRALKKGKPVRAAASSSSKLPWGHDDEDDDNDKGGADGKKERSQFGVWIGNLRFSVTRPQLFKWLVESSGGAITEKDITRVNLPTVRKAKDAEGGAAAAHNAEAPSSSGPANKGFAYVDFVSYEAQVAAVALSETELEGRRLLIKDSKSYEGRPSPAAAAAAAAAGGGAAGAEAAAAVAAAPVNTSTKLFVGNLGFETTEEDLRRHFAPCGPIAWAKVATFPDNTSKCRGYGWVQFDGETAAAAAASAVQGFVKIKEVVETEEDFVAEVEGEEGKEEEEEEADGGSDGNAEKATKTKPAPPKKAAAATPQRTKMRKWWVNMLKGRQLKVQFAEDDLVRYKKRFGKPPRPKASDGKAPSQPWSQRPQQQQQRPQQRENRDRDQDRSFGDKPKHRNTPRQQTDNNDDKKESANSNGSGAVAADKPFKLQDLSIAQRTGAVTASLGKKILFD